MAADLNQALDTMKFDVRMRDWNLKQGVVKQDDLDKHTKAIGDSAGACEPVTLEDKEDFE